MVQRINFGGCEPISKRFRNRSASKITTTWCLRNLWFGIKNNLTDFLGLRVSENCGIYLTKPLKVWNVHSKGNSYDGLGTVCMFLNNVAQSDMKRLSNTKPVYDSFCIWIPPQEVSRNQFNRLTNFIGCDIWELCELQFYLILPDR